MRILPIAEKWPKLHLEKPAGERPRFTTFRFQRRDRDYEIEEVVQPVYKPRTKNREVLGVAKIIGKALKRFHEGQPEGADITVQEAVEDGFPWLGDECGDEPIIAMLEWFIKAHGDRVLKEPLNKLTLEWIV
jgi:hypothetical protein